MGLLGTLGGLLGFIPGVGTAVGAGLKGIDALTSSRKPTFGETWGPSIATGVTGLLGGYLSGKEKDKERKQAFEDWQKSRKIKMADVESMLKPKLPRYSIEKSMPQFDEAIKKIAMGTAKEKFGKKGWGINFDDLFSSFNQKETAPPTVPAYNPVGPNREPSTLLMRGGNFFPQADNQVATGIMRKYGMQI